MTPFLTYILRSALALAVFYGIYELLLKRETYFQLNRLYLVSGLLLSFIIPAFPIASPFREKMLVPILDLPATSETAGRAFGPAELLPYLYWAGAALFLVRLGIQLIKLGRVVRRNGVGRLRGVKIVSVESGFPPFSFFGIVFLDKGLALDGNLRRILAHEEVHIRQQHTLDVLLMEIVLSLQWFNPIVWPYKKALQATHEYLADSGVIAQGYSSVKYKLLMFEQHVGASLFELGNNFRRSQIKRRIMMLSKAKSPDAAKLKLLLALPLVLALVLAFAEPRATAAPAGPQEHKKIVAGDPAIEKGIQVQDELKKLETMAKELKAKLEETRDATAREDLKKKLETVLKKRQQIEAVIAQSGGHIPPPPAPPAPPTPEELKAQYKMLEEKAADVGAQLEKATDKSEKEKLAQTLEKIRQKQAQIMEMAGSPKTLKVPATVEGLEQGLAKLQAKETDVRESLKTTADPKQKEELENTLNKIDQMRTAYKAALEDLKSGKVAKTEKIVK
jgi:hypothetical protein